MSDDPVVVTIPHKLGKAEAIRRMQGGLAKAATMLPLLTVTKEEWTGDELAFAFRGLGQTATGTATVYDNGVRVEVKLPPMLQKFGQVVANALTKRTELLLEKK